MNYLKQSVKLNIEMLPGSLLDALHELENDSVITGALGNNLMDTFLHARLSEWEEYRIHVTDWELNRYLETA